MFDTLTEEKKEHIFERLITGASDILSEELGIPKRSYQELKAMFENNETAHRDLNAETDKFASEIEDLDAAIEELFPDMDSK